MEESFAYICREKDGVIYTAVVEGNTVGWLHVAKRVSLESGSFYEILGLVVNPSYRNKGIWKKLVAQAIQWSRKEGAAALWVRSNLIRKQAYEFYIRQGFEQKKEQKVFEIKL